MPRSRRARETCPSPCHTRTPTLAGDRPPRYGVRNSHSYRRARACPSPGTDREETHSDTQSRRPRATEPETIAGDRPPRYGTGTAALTVGRGPVPRHATIARKPDRRPRATRYGACNDRGGQAPALRYRNSRAYRRARACPSPCNDREETRSQAEGHALRGMQRSRGTGPRATVSETAALTVGRGPSHATRASERVSLAMQRRCTKQAPALSPPL